MKPQSRRAHFTRHRTGKQVRARMGSQPVAALVLGLAALLAGGAVQARQPARVVQALQPVRAVAGELLVGLRAGVGPSGHYALFQNVGATFVDDVGQKIRVVRIRVPVLFLEAVKRRLESRPEVKFVEKNVEFDPALLPNDTQYGSQWHLPKIAASQAWDLTQGASGALIAILDSGIDATHPDLAGKLVPGYNTYSNSTDTTDPYGHGTEVAGAAAARTNNGEGVAGVAGAAPIMPVRVTNAAGAATSASIASGIIWAADHGARVVNLSFNGVAGNATIRAAAEYAMNHGTLVVAASGNCGCADPTPDNPFILSVGATDESDGLAYFSSTGAFVDLSAPGTNILTTAQYGLYASESGTSLASPIVAGVAALMFAANSALTPATVTQLLEATAFAPGGAGYDQAYGYGRVDAYAAVTAAAAFVPPPDTTPPTVTMNSPVQGGAVSGTTVVDVTASDDVGVAKVDVYVDGVFYVSDSTSPYSIAWDTSALANGVHTLQAVATDATNNSSSTPTVTVTVANTPPDTQPPTVSISAPAAGATVSGMASVSIGAADNVAVAKVELFVDGVLNATDTTAPFSFAWNTTGSSNGAHSLKVVATDSAGNSASVSRAVTVANNVNHAPVAVNDSFSAPYRAATSYTAQVFAVLANDSDADGNLNPASVKIVSSPNKGGAVTANGNGKVSYTPKKGYRGAETFTYNVKDSLGATSITATVTVTVQ
jgi:subtilisin family serine protease